MFFRGTTTALITAALLIAAACGKTKRDTAGTGTGEPTGSGGSGGEPGHGNVAGGAGAGGAGGESSADGQDAICTFTAPLLLPLRHDDVTCEVSVTATEPCLDAARCLCGEGASPPVDPSEVENCVGWYFVPRGETTFLDVCRTSPDQYTQSLADALSELLAGYVTTSPECDDTPATYGL